VIRRVDNGWTGGRVEKKRDRSRKGLKLGGREKEKGRGERVDREGKGGPCSSLSMAGSTTMTTGREEGSKGTRI